MSKINLLSPFVADLIAAGEVVERPASALKELLENSVDSGAQNVRIELRVGGAELIRVMDDGCGMSPDDAGIAFMRHATSKLADQSGLECISTLGFRGEALAAIAAISHIELKTREHDSDFGTRMLLDAGEIVEMSEIGCPKGTSITVRGLFYNTPARQKFLKTDRSETSACILAALRCALGHPEISFRCIRDGKEEFFTSGDGRPQSVIYSLLGRDLACSMMPCALESDGISIGGFVSSPLEGRGSRSSQYFFCNGRPIHSTLLQAAVEQAYRNTLLVGKFPACVIYLTLFPGSVDVNVHPTKAEVKFSEEKRVFDAVYHAALGALDKNCIRPPDLSCVPEEGAGDDGQTALEPDEPKSGATLEFRLRNTPYYQTHMNPDEDPKDPKDSGYHHRSRMTLIPPSPPLPTIPSKEEFEAAIAAMPDHAPVPELPTQPGDEDGDEEPIRIIGEAMDLYILAQYDNELYIIDKHAAHERMLFDQLIAQDGHMMSQSLIIPVAANVGAGSVELMMENKEELMDMGFDCSTYGVDAIAVRTAPFGMDPGEIRPAIEEIVEALRTNRRPEDARDKLLKTVACRSAIKAGTPSEPEEMYRLAAAVCRGEVRFCPHGRPVSIRFSREELDKQFKRIVT